MIVTGRDAAALERAGDDMRDTGHSVWTEAGDVTDDSYVERLVAGAIERWGHVDVLCNNAAFSDPATFLELSREQWDRVIGVALTAPFVLSQRVARHIVEAGRGVILNISSIAAHGADGNTNYAAAKTGLLSLTRDIAAELGPSGVRCVAVSPGWVDTPMMEEHIPGEMLEALRSGKFDRVPIGRLITIEEVAATCAFLASDEASGITGCEVLVDGGMVNTLHVIPTLAHLPV